jgi:riboflavin transporter FmnP
MKTKQIYNFITKVAIFAALSFILYFFPKFSLPFFPSFLEIQFSNLPALLGGFALGPIGGLLIVLVRFVLKLPFTSTACVGEFADLLIGLGVVVPASLIYKHTKTKKGGIISLVVALLMWVIMGVVTNYFVNIPAYIKMYFGGSVEPLVAMLQVTLPKATVDNYMYYYLVFAVIPFNLLLGSVVCLITFFVYKKISNIFKKDFFDVKRRKNKNEEESTSNS